MACREIEHVPSGDDDLMNFALANLSPSPPDDRDFRYNMIRCIIFVFFVLLTACTRGPYWEATQSPGLVLGVVEVPDPSIPCRAQALGCYQRETGVIYLQANMERNLRLCVLSHEYHHAAGFTHKSNEPGYGVDCGDGTIMPGTVT